MLRDDVQKLICTTLGIQQVHQLIMTIVIIILKKVLKQVFSVTGFQHVIPYFM